ncbi:NAD-dependent epimerase/dehydratase family protein [Carbonactinospora thermoautotrophica]|uniref:NAD-dependent epimerase/dehydratase family protein n=1 Tax=Carbonactinospora thermoautotrophica TaxID=1469144 RepID=UPI000ACAF807|nr:NAD-dependent epimerase/dehydratase family protein [Carbonactinospora thermoautotrophica]
MRVLVAGATGVIGRQLVPLLLEAGHEVVGLARSRTRAEVVERAGARLVVADALDRAALLDAVRAVGPDAVVHLLTAIPAQVNPRRMARDFTLTNRLRTEGIRNLLDAARAVGAQRFVAQSIAFAYDPTGSAVKNEDAPLWRDPPRQFAPVVAAVAELERLTRQAGGPCCGSGTCTAPGRATRPTGRSSG